MKQRIFWIGIAGAVTIGIIGMIRFFHGAPITISNVPISKLSTLTGLPCNRPDQRPVAVMLASDPEARPLSGIGEADMVFEMPVTPDGITRMMAVYQCGNAPKEIGSIRSARQDFIPLAQGLDAVLAHWGGEAGALAQLNSHIIDNVNALLYDGTIFYRKKGVPPPHNGFSTLALITGQADRLGYDATATIPGYLHESGQAGLNLGSLVDHISLSWPQHMDVEYQYIPTSNSYARSRGGTPEIDATTGQQVTVSTVIVIKTDAHLLHDQYISVKTLGQGNATIYQDGRQIAALWKKTLPTDMLIFTDLAGKPIPLAPGHIWIEYDSLLSRN